MTHRIYAGPFEALEPRLFEVIAELQKGDPLAPVSILVGSNILASYLRGCLADAGRTAANLRFHTFLGLVTRLSTGAAPAGGKPRMPGLGPALILHSVLDDHMPDAFREVGEFGGFRAALLDTFRDLRDAGITAEMLQQSLKGLVRSQPDRAGHLQGLADLYGRYRDRALQSEDIDDDFRRATASAALAGELLQTGALFIYGIYDVTGQQEDLLAALKTALELTYFVPYSGDSSSEFARPFLMARANELGVAPVHLSPSAGTASLPALAARIFTPALPPGTSGTDAQPLAADGSFALVSAPGDSRVAIEVVREIVGAIRDGIISGFHEAAVVLRNPEGDGPLIAEALRTRGIPCYIHGGSCFGERLFARAVMAIAALEAESFPRRSVQKAMELIAASLPADEESAWEVSEWAALSNDPRFLGGLHSWEEATGALVAETARDLERAASGVEAESDSEQEGRILSPDLARRRRRAALLLRGAWNSLRLAAAGWPEHLSWSGWAALLEEKLEPLLGRSDDWQAFCAALDHIGSLDHIMTAKAGVRASRSRMLDMLGRSFDSLIHPEGRFLRTGVNLLSTAAARGLRFPLVVIPGLDEGRFPARLRQDPLLLDHERLRVGRPSRLPLKSQRPAEEKLLFDMALRSAGKRLVLMSSRLDESSDRERLPSEFFLRATAAVRGSTVSLRELTEENVPGFRSVSLENPAPAGGLAAVDASEIRLRLITENRQMARSALEVLVQEDPDLLSRPMAFDRARWQPALTAYDGIIARAELVDWIVRTLGPGAGQVSASRIEEYARCPYLFYLKRALVLEAWVEAEPGLALDPLVRGKTIHRILEGFLRAAAGSLTTASDQDLWHELKEEAQRELAAVRPAGMPDLLWEIERDDLLQVLREWLAFERQRADEDLLPGHFECAFGRMAAGEDLPAYELQAGRHRFAFRGRIDRVDVSGAGRSARVIDYKTGRLPDSMRKKDAPLLMGGERIQLAVYHGALATLPDLDAIPEVHGEYLHLQPRDGQVVPRSFGSQDLRAAVERLPALLEIIGSLMESGVFFARTAGSVYPDGHCSYCDFITICGKDRERREQTKSGDRRVQRFGMMRQIDGRGEA